MTRPVLYVGRLRMELSKGFVHFDYYDSDASVVIKIPEDNYYDIGRTIVEDLRSKKLERKRLTE